MNKAGFLKINIFILCVLSCIFFLNFGQAFADKTQSNQLLKLNIEKSQNNGTVNIGILTSNPYKITLNPIKRSRDEYIIFLPDTHNFVKSKPDISTDSNIKDVDIKYIPYMESQAGAGYTKITVRLQNSSVKLKINDEIANSQIYSEETQKTSLEAPVANETVLKRNETKLSGKKPNNSQIIAAKPQILLNSRQIKNAETSGHKNFRNELKVSKAAKPPFDLIAPASQKKIDKTKIGENHKIPITILKADTSIKPVVQAKQENKTNFKQNFYLLILFIIILLIFIQKQRKKSLFKPNFNKKQENNPAPDFEMNAKNISDENFDVPEQSRIFAGEGLEVIDEIEITEEKSLHLVKLDSEKALIGVIGSEIFVLSKFNEMPDSKISVKQFKKLGNKNIFIVKVAHWEGLISVGANKMNLISESSC